MAGTQPKDHQKDIFFARASQGMIKGNLHPPLTQVFLTAKNVAPGFRIKVNTSGLPLEAGTSGIHDR